MRHTYASQGNVNSYTPVGVVEVKAVIKAVPGVEGLMVAAQKLVFVSSSVWRRFKNGERWVSSEYCAVSAVSKHVNTNLLSIESLLVDWPVT